MKLYIFCRKRVGGAAVDRERLDTTTRLPYESQFFRSAPEAQHWLFAFIVGRAVVDGGTKTNAVVLRRAGADTGAHEVAAAGN